jgi:hypothetical protein
LNSKFALRERPELREEDGREGVDWKGGRWRIERKEKGIEGWRGGGRGERWRKMERRRLRVREGRERNSGEWTTQGCPPVR